MPTASEARELAEECDRLVVTATTPENRALLLKIAQLWRDVAAREDAVESGHVIAIGDGLIAHDAAGPVLASTHAEVLLLQTRAKLWRRKASYLRQLSEDAHHGGRRAIFARLANNYEGLADQADLTALNLTGTDVK